MQHSSIDQIIDASSAQQRAQEAALMAHWPKRAAKPAYINDPHFAAFCFAVADALLQNANEENQPRILA